MLDCHVLKGFDPFNDWGGAGSSNFVPALGGDDTKIAPTGDIFGQPPGGMSSVRGKLANHVGDHVVLSPEGAILVTSTGTESSYPRPPQSLNNSFVIYMIGILGSLYECAGKLLLASPVCRSLLV